MFSFKPSKKKDEPLAVLASGRAVIPIYSGTDMSSIPAPRGATFRPFYSLNRLTMFVAGAQGCGKSYFIANTVKQLLMTRPQRPVVLFTGLDEKDANFDGLPIRRVSLDKIEQVTLDKLRFGGRGSICIFDDVDRIRDKTQHQAVQRLAMEILSNGRDHTTQKGIADIDIIISNHELNDYRRTKYILSDCQYVVLFPGATTHMQMDIILRKIGTSAECAEQIKASASRSVIIHKNYPLYFISDDIISSLR